MWKDIQLHRYKQNANLNINNHSHLWVCQSPSVQSHCVVRINGDTTLIHSSCDLECNVYGS